MLYDNLFKTGLLIEKVLPSLKPGLGIKIVQWVYILAIGIQHMTDPSPIAKEVIEKENLKGFDLRFDVLYEEMIDLIFKGIE